MQAWALFKGKFREGIDKPDPPTWKTRLRCALNKSNDFEELVDRSQLDISDPYKVYRIVPEGAKKSQYCNQTLRKNAPSLSLKPFKEIPVVICVEMLMWLTGPGESPNTNGVTIKVDDSA